MSAPSTDGISVVVTVRNDREGLAELLESLTSQTRRPDEVVIVDGGSTDGTLALLDERRRDGLPLCVLELAGANISAGRNAGIGAARHEWIACTDAGCRPLAGWLASIDRAREGVEFVAGVFAVDARTPTERAVAVALYPALEEIEAPSAGVRAWLALFGKRFSVERATGRSMAFTKRAWQAVGGFPEHVYTGEDTAFSTAIGRLGVPARLEAGAVVLWRPRPTWRDTAGMCFVYARGDVRIGSLRAHGLRTAVWLTAAALMRAGRPGRALLLTGALIYASLPLVRARRAGDGAGVWMRVPVAIAVKDLSYIAGAATGLLDACGGKRQPTPAR